MGHCISDATNNDDKNATVKLVSYSLVMTNLFVKYEEEGDEPEFFSKKMNNNVIQEVESFKRAQFSDGLGKQDMTKSITTIQY